MDEERLDEEEAIGMLYICDCPDDSQHSDPKEHQIYCDYYLWYMQELTNRRLRGMKD